MHHGTGTARGGAPSLLISISTAKLN